MCVDSVKGCNGVITGVGKGFGSLFGGLDGQWYAELKFYIPVTLTLFYVRIMWMQT